MQASQNTVIHQLASKLKLDGRWYYTGSIVALSEEDAAIYASRGLSSPAPAGSVPMNVASIPAAQVGLVVKEESAPAVQPSAPRVKGHHGMVSGKRR